MHRSDQEPDQEHIDTAWADVVRFLRQLSHDIRNHLNAVELQSAFLAELASDPELKDEIKRLRKMVAEAGGSLQKLSSRINPPAPNITGYRASDFVEDLRTKIRADFPKEADTLQWTMEAGDTELAIDPLLLREALLEILRNAFENRTEGASIHFIAKTEGDSLVVTLNEPKPQFDLPTANWGRQPLRYLNRGHYGLGLNRARTIIEAHGGKLSAAYDSQESKLVTTIVLPRAKPER